MLELLEHPDYAQPTFAIGAGPLAGAQALYEVLAFDAQRLKVGDSRGEDVARAGDVLAVAPRGLLDPLVVDSQLALERHVVERRHSLGADDREAALLVG